MSACIKPPPVALTALAAVLATALVVCQLINCGLGGTGVSPVQPRELGQDARATHKKQLDKPLAVSAVPGQPAAGASPARDGILLLRNGNLLQGKITERADRYAVVVDGGEIHVKASEVLSVCRTLQEGYRKKQSFVRPGNVRDHLELALWCQRYGLLECAAEQLAEAKALDPRYPMIPLVERRIQISPFRPKAVDRAAAPSDSPPPPEDLDVLARGMPPGSIERFTQTIQPLLANNCSAAGCHGPNTESRFRLLRIPSGRPASRRLTQRNLHSTLQWVDRKDPAASPILTAPIRPHGPAKTAVFTDQHVTQYKQLVDWVYQVARRAEPQAVATVSHEESAATAAASSLPPSVRTAVHNAPVESADGRLSELSPAASLPDAIGPPTESHANSFAPEADQGSSGARPSVQRGAPLPQYVPVDPFDPEIFNRRFFPDEAAP